MIIDSVDEEPDYSTYYDMWAAAVAVNEICVKKGLAGVASRLGESIFSPLRVDR